MKFAMMIRISSWTLAAANDFQGNCGQRKVPRKLKYKNKKASIAYVKHLTV